MKIQLSTLPVTLMATVTHAAAQYPAFLPGDRDVIVIIDPEVEREKVRTYRTKVLREAQEARKEESRARASEQARKELRAKVRRLRGQ